MKIPNFNTEEGSILYSHTVGKRISPRVAELLAERVRSRLSASTPLQILDLGCGPGTLSIPLASEFKEHHFVGVDGSSAMIQLCMASAQERTLTNTEWMTMDAADVAFGDATYHLVLCNLAFPFFRQPNESMLQLRSVVREDGEVWFTVPGRHTWEAFFEIANQVMGDAVRMARPFLVKFDQAEKLPGALESSGFDVLSEERVLIPFSFPDGASVLAFLTELFHLLDAAPPLAKQEMAEAIDKLHPDGFTMCYEAVILHAKRAN